MEQEENIFLVEKIIQIFYNNLKFIDILAVKKVFDKLIEKDNKNEMNLNMIIENIYDVSYDNSNIDERDYDNSNIDEREFIEEPLELLSLNDSLESLGDNTIKEIADEIFDKIIPIR